MIIFASDHGELLGDDGMLHKGLFFFDSSIRVPMIWRFPDRIHVPAAVDTGFASAVDMAPTVAELADIQGPHRMQGRPLSSRDDRLRPVPAGDAALTEWRGSHIHQTDGNLCEPAVRCLVTDDWKFVHDEGKPFGELYDRKNDPRELRNRWADPDKQDQARQMRDRLLTFILESEPLPTKTDFF